MTTRKRTLFGFMKDDKGLPLLARADNEDVRRFARAAAREINDQRVYAVVGTKIVAGQTNKGIHYAASQARDEFREQYLTKEGRYNALRWTLILAATQASLM